MNSFDLYVIDVNAIGLEEDSTGLIPRDITLGIYHEDTKEAFDKSWEFAKGFYAACYLNKLTPREAYEALKNLANAFKNSNEVQADEKPKH